MSGQQEFQAVAGCRCDGFAGALLAKTGARKCSISLLAAECGGHADPSADDGKNSENDQRKAA